MNDYYNYQKKTELNYFHQNRDIFAALENFGITLGTAAFVLRISDTQIWMYSRGMKLLPPQCRRKLQKLIEKLERSQAY